MSRFAPSASRQGTSFRDVRPTYGVLLLSGQIRYELTLVLRSPIGAFITLVIPLMLLVALDLVTPEMTLESLGRLPVRQFLTPAMGAFAVLNAGFVDTIVAMTLARDKGVLKRLFASPLPQWVYLVGRLVAAFIIAALSVALVLCVGVFMLHARIARGNIGPFIGAASAGLVTSFAVGSAVASLVRSADAALPIAYGLLLPVAFVSQVFFPAPTEAHWLQELAKALPVQPIASSMEAAFSLQPTAISTRQLVLLGAWALVAFLVTIHRFSSRDEGARGYRSFVEARRRRQAPKRATPR